MRWIGILAFALASGLAVTASAADAIEIFGRHWTVPVAEDWKVDTEDGASVLRLMHNRGPLPGPRRSIQFALTGEDYGRVTVEVDVKPLGGSLMLVFAYRDEAHFDYAHFSVDTAAKQPVHNGIFHVYGGERVRISGIAGPAAFPEGSRWYHVKLIHDATTGTVSVAVDGHELPALKAVDLSLGGGKVGIGSFDETAVFRNVKISASGSGSTSR